MDIVTLKGNKRRYSSRRHTTEVSIEQLPSHNLAPDDYMKGNSASSENLDVSLSQDSYSTLDRGLSQQSLSSSWSSLIGSGTSDQESDVSTYATSQVDIYSDLPSPSFGSGPAHQYQLSYELALDNVLTPFSTSEVPPVSPLALQSQRDGSRLDHVIRELVSTEKDYVTDLTEIIEGYIVPMKARVGKLPLTQDELLRLFGNLQEIRDFNKFLLIRLLECGHDAAKVGRCFLSQAEGFKIYTQYCNNYPSSVAILARLYKDHGVSRVLKTYQRRLRHMLPLGAYLLKPVQRILKYPQLLKDMSKKSKRAIEEVELALEKMTEVAKHVDTMKEKYDTAIHVQEVQSLIKGWEGIDLSKYGDLVLEENMRSYSGTFRGRSERLMFLFQRLLLITKKEEDGYQYKAHFEMKDIQLTERLEKDPNSFQIRQVSTGRFFTFQSRSLQIKEQWVIAIKLLLMESIPHLPDKARHLILAGFPTGGSSDRSPPRHRHTSEDLAVRQRHLKSTSKTLLPHTSSQSYQKFRHQRSATIPHIRIASPTLSLVQASLSGIFGTTLEKDESTTDENEEEQQHPPNCRDSEESAQDGLPTPYPRSEFDSHKELIEERLLPMTDTQILPPREAPSEDDNTIIVHNGTSQNLQAMDVERLATQSNENQAPTTKCDSAPFFTGTQSNENQAQTTKCDSAPFFTGTQSNENQAPTTKCDSAPFFTGTQSNENQLPTTKCGSDPVFNGDRIVEESVSSAQVIKDSSQQQALSHDEELDKVPTQENELDTAGGTKVFTHEDEDLFVNLMGTESSSTKKSYEIPQMRPAQSSTLSRSSGATLMKALSDLQGSSDESSTEDESQPQGEHVPQLHYEDDTPKSSPFAIRRRVVTQISGSPHTLADTDVTPVASPTVAKHHPPVETAGFNSQSSDENVPIVKPPPQFLFDTVSNKSSTGSIPTVEVSSATAVPSLPDESSDQSESRQSNPNLQLKSVVRRHSFNSNYQRSIERTPQSATSMYYSPSLQAKAKQSKHRPEKGGVRRYSSFHEDSIVAKKRIAVVGLVSTTRSDHSLEDLPSIESVQPIVLPYHSSKSPLLSTDGVAMNTRKSPSPTENKRHNDRSPRVLLRFQRSRRASKAEASSDLDLQSPISSRLAITPEPKSASVLPTYQGNPDERLSFDEILASFDNYAMQTGETNKCRLPATKSKHSASPEGQIKVKKSRKKRRSNTVATIDAATMKEVRASMSENQSSSPRLTPETKVHQLAKEYSDKIRDRQRSRVFHRYSTLLENTESEIGNETSDTPQAEPQPGWLRRMKRGITRSDHSNRNTPASSISDSVLVSPGSLSHQRDSTSDGMDPSLPQPQVLISFDDSEISCDKDEEEDTGMKGRFRGWVRTLVDKFSGKDK